MRQTKSGEQQFGESEQEHQVARALTDSTIATTIEQQCESDSLGKANRNTRWHGHSPTALLQQLLSNNMRNYNYRN